MRGRRGIDRKKPGLQRLQPADEIDRLSDPAQQRAIGQRGMALQKSRSGRIGAQPGGVL